MSPQDIAALQASAQNPSAELGSEPVSQGQNRIGTSLNDLADNFNQSESSATRLAQPDVDKDKVAASKIIASQIGKQPSDIYDNLEFAIEKQSGKKQSAGEFVKGVKDYTVNLGIDNQVQDILWNSRGNPSPEQQKQINALEEQKSKDTPSAPVKFALDAVRMVTGTVSQYVGTALDVADQAAEYAEGVLTSSLVTKVIGLDINPDTSEAHFKASAEAASRAAERMIGATYLAGKEEGKTDTSAWITAGVSSLVQNEMMVLPVGVIANTAKVAFAEALGKTLIKKTAIRAAQAVAKQGSMAMTYAAANVLVEEFGNILSKKVGGMSPGATSPSGSENVAERRPFTWDDYKVVMSKFTEQAVPMALVGAAAHLGGHLVGKFASHLDDVAKEANKAQEKANAPEGTEAGVTAKGEVPPRSEPSTPTPEAVAKEAVDKMSVGEILDETPPEVHPQGAGTEEATPVEAIPSFSKYGDTKPEKMMGVADGMKASLNPDSVSTPRISAMLDRAKLEFQYADSPEAWGEAEHRIQEAGRAMDKSFGGNSFASEMESAGIATKQEIETGVSRETRSAMTTAKMPSITEQVEADPRYKAAQDKLTAAREALDSARKQAGMQKADQIASLSEALDSARQEARMTEDNLKAEKVAATKQAVANEQAKVAKRESIHKSIDTLKNVDPSKFDKEGGDAIREIQEHFEQAKKPKAQRKPTSETIDIDALKAKLAEAKAAHEDIAPEVEAALQSMPSRYSKLSPDQLEGLVAIVKNLDTIRKTEGKIRTAEGWVEKSKLQEDANKSIAPPRKSLFGPGMAALERKAKSLWRIMTNSFSMNGELVFGGKGTLTHQVAVQHVLNSHGDFLTETTRQQAGARDYLRNTLKIDEQKTPLKWQNYWNEKFTEDGVTLTREEIMDNYMSFENENQRNSLLEDGTAYASHVTDTGNAADVEKLSGTTYHKFFSHLGTAEHGLIDIAKKQLEENGPSLSSYHENRYGNPIKVEPNYWPKYVKREGASYSDDITEIQKENSHIKTNPDESSLISRTGAKGATYTTGFWHKFSESTRDSSRILKMGDAVAASARVLFDPKIADRIAKTYGNSVLKSLREDLAREAGQRETPHELERAMDELGNLATNLHLGIISSLKVPFKLAALGMRSFINNPHGFFPAVMEVIRHPFNSQKAARAFSSTVDEAYKYGGSVDLGQLTKYSTKMGKVRSVARVIQNKNMILTRKGSNFGFAFDATTSRYEAEYQFNRALKGKQMDADFKAVTGVSEDQVENLSPEAKMAAVGKYADSIIGETHAIQDPGYALGLQKTAIGRLITKFKTEPLKGFEQIRRQAMRFHRNKTAANAGKLFSAIAIYGAIEGALIYGINEGVNALFGVKPKTPPTLGETERQTDLSMIPMVGDMVNEHLYLAQHPWVAQQQNVVEGMAVLPLNTILDTVIMHSSAYTPSQQRAAAKRVARDMKSIFNTPLNIANLESQ